MAVQPHAAGIILAAGLGRRFGGHKLLASLDGRPLLQHVLDAAAAASRLDPVIVVLGSDADELREACEWRRERVVINDQPERGISGSLRLAIDEAARSGALRALVLLGDQPRLSAVQASAVLALPADPARPITVPRYGGVPGNPVLLEAAAWPLARDLAGDRGMSQLFATRPELVRHVDIEGTNPGVDTPADLAALSRAAAPGRSARREGAGHRRP